jgi:HEAT repeat protein
MSNGLAWALITVLLLSPLPVRAGATDDPEVQNLLAGLEDRDWQVRRDAARELGAIARRDGAIVTALRSALDDDDSRVRRSAATALGQIGPGAAGATPQLVERLQDDDPEVVRSSTAALGLIGRRASRASRDLKPLLADSSPELRLAAADALGRIGRESVASTTALVALLGHARAPMRMAAAQALGRIGADAAKSVPELIKRLGDDDPQVRLAAAEALGRIGQKAVPGLIVAMNAGNPVFLQSVVEALARVGQPAVPALVETLEDEAQSLLARQHAAKALARIGNGKNNVVPPLLKRLEDGNSLVRIAVVEALGNLGPQAGDAAAPLLALIDDRDEDDLVREYAITALARVASDAPDVNARLVEAVADSNSRISGAAVAALMEIRARDRQVTPVSLLAGQLRDADPALRLAAANRLADLGPYGREAVPALAGTLGDDASGVELRIAVARALGMIGPAAETALPELRMTLRGSDAALKDAALIAMRRIGPQTRSIPALMEALHDSDLGVRGSAAMSIRNFVLARLGGWDPLLAQSDAPVLRDWISRHDELYGIDDQSAARAELRHETATTDYFDVLGGRAGVRESVQLQTIASRGNAQDERSIPLADVKQIDVESHPFSKMLKDSGRAPGHLSLADVVPQDRFLVWFRNPAALREFMGSSGDLFLRLESAFSLKSFDYDLAARYLARLGLPESLIEQLAGTDMIGEIGFVTPDLFFIEGTDITAIIRARTPALAGTVLASAGMLDPGETAVGEKRTAAGHDVRWARRGALLFISTSADELQGVLALHGNAGKDSLGRSDEFRYMLQQLPVADATQAYFYFSDAFIRRLTGPRTKIAQLRRVRARADLDMLTAGALLYKLDGNTSAPTKARLVELGYVPKAFADRDYTIDGQMVARSAEFGSSADLVPLDRMPVDLVSKAESSAYESYVDNYSKYWQQFFDPIAIRLDASGSNERELTTFILPLLDSTVYDELRDTLTDAGSGLRLEVPQLTPAPVMLASLNLSDSMRLRLVKVLTGILEKFTSVDPAIFDAFTPTVHLAVQDSTPIVAVGSGDVLGAFSEKMLQMEGFEPFLPILLSLVSQPSSVYIELAEPQVVLGFLRDAVSGRGEGGFHQLEGEDTWIYSVNLMDLAQVHLRVAVENEYLVISNLPWSERARQTGTSSESLNGARLELNLGAMSQQLPALHTRAYSDYRIAAIDGMGYLYPLLASGTAESVDEALQKHLALFGYRPAHPGSGGWVWQDGVLRSSTFGTPQSPVQPAYRPGDRNFGLFPTLDSLQVAAQLEDTGLRTRIRWRVAAP